jgi:GT2 family glycosyltransferase
MNSTMPFVSIVIVNYNGLNLLKKCLSSLSEIDFLNYEIILVDNNSTDDTIQYITKMYPQIIVIKLEKNKGFAEPNNIASKIAKGEYLLFLNNDTIVTKNFLTELLNSINKNKQIGICQSLLLKLDNSIDSSGDFIDELGVVYNSKTSVTTDREISSARGASMLIRKEIFNELKGFDEKFFVSFEDVDLGWRTWIKGYKVVLSTKSIVYHLGGQTTNKIKSDIAFHGFKNQLSMKITNFESILSVKKMISFFIIYGIHEIKIWFDYTVRGTTNRTSTKYEKNLAQKPNFKTIFKSILWIINNIPYLLKKQQFVNSSRKFSTTTLQKRNILINKYE